MNIKRYDKGLKLGLTMLSMSILVLVLASCAGQSGAAQQASSIATTVPALATAAAPTVAAAQETVTVVEPTVAAAATEVATAAPAATGAMTTTTTGATTNTVTSAAMVMISKNDKLGDILTDGKGTTLYLFTKDTKNTSNCYDKCAVNWPPLMTTGQATAGTGADQSLLGTTTRKDGSTQVTYNGWPLYYYIKDQKPGDVTGQDVGKVWYVLNAKGEEVETPGGAAAAPAASGSSSSAGGTVMIAKNDKLGDILADAKGMTLYLYTKDTKNTSNCYDKCAANWPPLMTTGKATAGTGADVSLLGTTTRKDGSTQVTYNGWPLYYFIKDQKPGDVTGQDVGGVWYVLSAKGEEVETPGGAAASTPAASSSAPAAAGKTVDVPIQNFSFGQPLTVPVGTTVVWTNKDSAAHTVTASDGSFDSGSLDQGATFSFTFSKAGTFNYTCQFHPNMKGTITVTG